MNWKEYNDKNNSYILGWKWFMRGIDIERSLDMLYDAYEVLNSEPIKDDLVLDPEWHYKYEMMIED